jgi:radical SAM protein with 4Fe4S-binding SPASM domain
MSTQKRLTWKERLFGLRAPEPTQATALRHFTRETDGAVTRFHLRVDPDGGGMLLANAANACRLSASGTAMAEGVLSGEDDGRILAELASRFSGVDRAAAGEHLRELRGIIDALASSDDNYPITNFDDPGLSPHARQLGAPFRADMPVGDPEQMLPLLTRLWEVGIPHVCFVAPRDVSKDRLVRLVERAGDLGMICGVRGSAAGFGDDETIHALAQAGVDHLTYTICLPAETHAALLGDSPEASLRAMECALAEDVCPVAQVPLLATTTPALEETISMLASRGIRNQSFFAVAEREDEEETVLSAWELPPVATRVEEAATGGAVRFLWEVPVLRRPEVPLARQVCGGPRAAGDVSIRVQPDGAVVPPRGRWESAGNLLANSWEEIWNHPAFRVFREKVESPGRCDRCPGLAICAAACPADAESWADDSGAEV